MSFNFRDFSNFKDNLINAQGDMEHFVEQFLIDQSLVVIALTKPNTPVDTGALRNMWGIGRANIVVLSASPAPPPELNPASMAGNAVEKAGNIYNMVIFNGMDYASFVEYGATTRGGNWRDGVFMLTKAMTIINTQMSSALDVKFKEFLRQRGVN